MFWADAVERSRTERLGRAKASQLRKQRLREAEMTDSEKARLADVWIKLPPPAPDVMPDTITPEFEPPAVRPDVVSQFMFSVGQQVDASTSSATSATSTTASSKNLLLSLSLALPLATVGGYTNCLPTSPLRFEYATPLDLAKFLVGEGVNVDESSVVFEGYQFQNSSTQVAKFFGGQTIFDNNENMDEGVVLTTGNVNVPLCQSQLAQTEPNPNPMSTQSKFDSFAWPKQEHHNINPALVKMCEVFYTAKNMATDNCKTYQDQSQLSFTFSITNNLTLGIVSVLFFTIFFVHFVFMQLLCTSS